jgi:hypothetical protein
MKPIRSIVAPAAAGLVLAGSVVFAVGCDDTTTDDQTRQLIPIEPTAAETTKPVSQDVSRRSLRVIPFSADFSRAWTINAGTAGTVVEAKTAAGDFDIYVMTKEAITTQVMQLHLGHATAATTRPASAPATQPVPQERPIAVKDAFGIEYVDVDSQGFVTIRAKLFVPVDGKDPNAQVSVYELNINSLTAEQYKADREMLRKFVDSIEYDPAALRTGN